MLAISEPILTERTPLRTRTSVHSTGTTAKHPTASDVLLQGASNIARTAKAGQVVISEDARQAINSSIDSVEFVEVGEAEVPTQQGGFVLERLYEVIALKTILLTPDERDALFQQKPDTKQGGGFQAFLVKLQERMEPDSNELTLTVDDRERIARYAFDYRGGGWQARLKRIFGRTLGQNLEQ